MTSGSAALSRIRVRVRGRVQGVGFRPFVFGLAERLALSGWVRNDSQGVVLEAQGGVTALTAFLAALSGELPPLARIATLETEDVPPSSGEAGFVIQASRAGGATQAVIPADAAVCPACLAELFCPQDRRWRYPFITCTHCGPRYTLTRHLPYDRPQTTMAAFPLCPDCAREYADPRDRRFHAQPVACPACGPQLSHAPEAIWAALRQEAVVALKGAGGFHLVCDAGSAAAVARLRASKQRDGKPFAVMALNPASARLWAVCGPEEAELLQADARPIVLLDRPSRYGRPLPAAVSGALPTLGVMLPVMPVHYLLFYEAAGRPAGLEWLDAPLPVLLVMTSANPGGEPLVIGNAEAQARLAGLADLIVTHDRDIVTRVDDSVVRRVGGGPVFLRRGRGWVPEPVPLSRDAPPVLALGGHLKTTVCLTRGGEAMVSQHVGTVENAATVGFLEETVTHLQRLLAVRPVRLLHDAHPDFLTTRLARQWAAAWGIPCQPVQHHHAHLLAAVAESGHEGPALGLVLDGTGHGVADSAGLPAPARQTWGGELLATDGQGGWQRLGHLAALPLPGGDLAARQPWRMAAGVLHRLGRGAQIAPRFAAYGPAASLAALLTAEAAFPTTTACGRWFDAAAGLLGACLVAGYEGEAAMRLEAAAEVGVAEAGTLPVLADGWTLRDEGRVLDVLPLLAHLADFASLPAGAALFHGTLAAALVAWSLPFLAARQERQIFLSGGCLVNRLLAEALLKNFALHGIAARLPRVVPPGDGGLSLGQAWAGVLHETA